jgi:hypothetical protein
MEWNESMTLEQKKKRQHEIGFSILNKLFRLKKNKLIKVLKGIFKDNEPVLKILADRAVVQKILENDQPVSLSIYYHNSIHINHLGIRYKTEDFAPYMIFEFDKSFSESFKH